MTTTETTAAPADPAGAHGGAVPGHQPPPLCVDRAMNAAHHLAVTAELATLRAVAAWQRARSLGATSTDTGAGVTAAIRAAHTAAATDALIAAIHATTAPGAQP